MTITEAEVAPSERYQFEETGVGCAEHADPTCLCDVDLDLVGVAPIRFLPGQIEFSSLARELTMRADDKVTFEGWAAWLLTVKDEAERVKVTALCEVLSAARNDDLLRGGVNEMNAAYSALLKAGYTTPKCAAILNVTPEHLFHLRTSFYPKRAMAKLGLDGLLVMEQMLLDGAESFAEVARQVGTTQSVVTVWAGWMGVSSAKSKEYVIGKRPDVVAAVRSHGDLSIRACTKVVNEELGTNISRAIVQRIRQADKRSAA